MTQDKKTDRMKKNRQKVRKWESETESRWWIERPFKSFILSPSTAVSRLNPPRTPERKSHTFSWRRTRLSSDKIPSIYGCRESQHSKPILVNLHDFRQSSNPEMGHYPTVPSLSRTNRKQWVCTLQNGTVLNTFDTCEEMKIHGSHYPDYTHM